MIDSPYFTRAMAAEYWCVDVASIDRWIQKFGWRVHYTPQGSVRLLAEDVKKAHFVKGVNKGHFKPKLIQATA